MLTPRSFCKAAARKCAMELLLTRSCGVTRQPAILRRDCLRAPCTHAAAAASQFGQARHLVTVATWVPSRTPCALQCRASSTDNGASNGDGEKRGPSNSSSTGDESPELSESEPGVQRQEDASRPADATPDITAAAASASQDKTDGADASQGTGTSLLRPLSTYREALATWFYARKDDLQEAFGVPAVTVFGRTFDFRSMLKSSPVLASWNNVITTMLLQVDFRRILDLSVWPSGSSDDDSLETAASKGRQQRAADGASAEDGTSQGRHPAAEALRRGGHAALGFGFSAGGLLFPYYIGVMYGLHDLGVITPETRIGGASAGSLAAACYHSGLSEKTVTDACLVLCDDCRRNGTRGRLRHVLKLFLEKLLPSDIHERCSGRAHVAVTTVFPRPRGLLVSEFSSRDDLIAALLTSCHIPWWFDSSVWTSFRGRASYDGGLTNFIPLPPSAQHGVRVCCFPSKQVSAIYEIAISPDSFEDWPIPLNQMVSWAFEPADEETLRFYIAKGRADAKAWAEATDVLGVLREGNFGAAKRNSLISDDAAARQLSSAA